MAGEVSDSLRMEVVRRAEHRCEYCLIRDEDAGFSHQIDHVISLKHGGSSAVDNLALACLLCNRHKGTDLGSIDLDTGELVRLFNPRRDRWREHFKIMDDCIEPLTPIGSVTVRLLRLNAAERRSERRLLQALEFYPRR
jgi:5-methylcytosine-specific restriction endonuclease McrA